MHRIVGVSGSLIMMEAQELHRESINLSMSTVSSCLAAMACLSERNFLKHPTLQKSSTGTEVFRLRRAALIFTKGSLTGSSWDSLPILSRLDPVVLLTSLEQILATTLTAKLLLALRPLQNLQYLARMLDLMLGIPPLSRLSTRYVWVALGTSQASFTQVDQQLNTCLALSLKSGQVIAPYIELQ